MDSGSESDPDAQQLESFDNVHQQNDPTENRDASIAQNSSPSTNLMLNVLESALSIFRHTYLGDVEDVEYCCFPLVEMEHYILSIVPLRDVVVFPGMIFPLLFGSHDRIQTSIKYALAAAAPLRGLLAVYQDADWLYANEESYIFGCLAEIKQTSTREERPQSVIAVGRQRIKIRINHRDILERAQTRNGVITAEVQILSQTSIPPMPSELKRGLGFCPQWIAQQFDPFRLADSAFQKAKDILDDVTDLRKDPKQFSYWLASALPIDCNTRQFLLQQENETYRLQKEIKILSQLTAVCCKMCNESLANTKDLIQSSEMAPSQLFVNAYGHIHDMMMLKTVQRITLHGQPTTEHSWFPGYAWVLAHCPHCFSHLGWMFNAVERDLQPRIFWGFSRSQITHVQAFSEDGGDGELD